MIERLVKTHVRLDLIGLIHNLVNGKVRDLKGDPLFVKRFFMKRF